MTEPAAAHGDGGDLDIEQALNGFLIRALPVAAGQVQVEYQAGVAVLHGTAPDATRASAIEDLIRWHDQVDSVVNDLRVEAVTATPRLST